MNDTREGRCDCCGDYSEELTQIRGPVEWSPGLRQALLGDDPISAGYPRPNRAARRAAARRRRPRFV